MRAVTDWLFESDSPMAWRDVAIMLSAMILPAVVAVTLYGRMGAVAFVAALPAHLASKDAGPGVGALVTLTMGLAGFLVLSDPGMTLFVAPIVGAMTGICGLFGYSKPAIRGLITWPIFTSSILETNLPHVMFGVFLLAMCWSLWLTWWTGQAGGEDEDDEGEESQEYAAVFAVLLGVGLFLSVWFGEHFFGPHGFWFPLTFVILVLPPHGTLFSRTAKRTIGTILGTILAVLLARWTGGGWMMIVAGILAMPLGFRFLPRNYTVFTTLLTVAVLVFLGLVSSMDQLAGERLWTMAAAAAMTAALGGLGILALWRWKPGALKALQEA